MTLTKNEKKTLKLLLDNAKISDSTIATKLKISSQAVGKIRKKLEKEIIKSYTIEINYSKLGINLFALAHAKLTQEGLDTGELEVEKKLLNEPNIIQIFRIPRGSLTHAILFGFKNIQELDEFFSSKIKENSIHKYIENKDLFTFSNYSYLKNNPKELINKMLENSENQKNKIIEIEKFKERLK